MFDGSLPETRGVSQDRWHRLGGNMLTRCPVCRAQWQGQTLCRRCGAELHLIEKIVVSATELERLAVKELLEGRPTKAMTTLRQAARLRVTPLGRALAGFAASRRG